MSLYGAVNVATSWNFLDHPTPASVTEKTDEGDFTLWFTLCSLTCRRCNQQGLGLSGLVHEKAHLVSLI